MELQLFLYKDVALHFYYSKDSVIDGKICVENIFAYFPGLPQIINEDFFVDKVDKDTAFFSVYYLGSLYSGGSFTYKNCIKTIEIAIEFIKSKKGIKTFDNKEVDWDYKNLNVVGYSFSGNPIVSTKISKNDVKNVIFFSPLFFLNKKEVVGFMNNESMNNFYGFNMFYLAFLRRGYKFLFRGLEENNWDTFFSGEYSESFVNIPSDYPNIIIFHGKTDEKVDYNSSLFFQKNKCLSAIVVLVDGVGHSLSKLFNIKEINKLIN